jgi:chemotaxis protein CheY-P-specific phosphatase CheC
LLEHLTKEKVDLASLTEIQKSALKEIGNICLCWYLIAVSKMIDIDMIPAPPDATVDMLGAVLDIPLASLAQKVDTVLAVHTCFKGIDEEFEGYFLMLPEESTLKLILERMTEP